MGKDDWYRNEVWNSLVEADFFAKLSKARSQRDQYFKIQIYYLIKPYPRDALRLCEVYLDTKKVSTWDLEINEYRAIAHEQLGEIEKAIDTYKHILQNDPKTPFFPQLILVQFPYLIARKGEESDFPHAMDTLKRANIVMSERGIKLKVEAYLYHASLALISKRLGDKQKAKQHAVIALEEYDSSHSGLQYHPNFGLVGSEHNSTVQILKSFTKTHSKWFPWFWSNGR